MAEQARILVVQVAALGHGLVRDHAESLDRLPLRFEPIMPVFPALTCTAQATFRTGLPPARHGMVANGLFDRATRRTDFWNQSARLLPPARIWDGFRSGGGTVGTMFWQQSLGDSVDLVVSPAPIHKHHGGMIQDCYAQPPGLYADLCKTVGRRFNLMNYWGPLASVKATRWITDATIHLLQRPDVCPDVLLTYLPHLDYTLQKHGPKARGRVSTAVGELVSELDRLTTAAGNAGYRVLLWGDYPIVDVDRAVLPNVALRENGLLAPRRVGKRTYVDLFASRAFAMVDHQIAHVFADRPADAEAARDCLQALPGVAEVLDHSALDHPRSGELLLVADPDAWFAYPWWTDRQDAPDYATHVDIHSKPGFDPCELFWGWPPPSVSLDLRKVRGSHGRADQPACFATDLELDAHPTNLLQLTQALARLLGHGRG